MDKIQNLLQQVSIIQKKYDEIAKITGENFNIFSIMRAESDEVRTHSRIIAEFLNPKGKHCQGSVFLKLFFEHIGFLNDIKENFDFDSAKVLVEEHIGKITGDYSEGGVIDIVIKDSKNQIVIENKIHAGDQKGQLLRYAKKYPNCKLIYLTLEGKQPTKLSYQIDNGQELSLSDIILVSYKDDLKKWLENCLEKTYSLPVIRETLVQYLNLVKKLTNQSTNKEMSSEIQNLILNNFLSAEQIVKEFDSVKQKICGSIREGIIANLKIKLSNKYDISDKNSKIGDKNSKIWIESKEYMGNSLLFAVEPFSGNGGIGPELFCGIIDLQNKNKDLFVNVPEFNQNGWWRDVKYFQDFENFNIDFSNSVLIDFLGKNQSKKEELIKVLSQQIINYVESKENVLFEIYKEIDERK